MVETGKGRRKIAVLGGGLGSMTAAWELSHADEDCEITVYQLGWRLGGKGASGRNRRPGMSRRIEEHGIHVFSGLYDNAFRMMRHAYAELGRAPDAPLGTWMDAWKPHNTLVVEELWKGKWLPWVSYAPVNDELPGEDDARLFLDPWDYVGEALSVLRGFLRQARRNPKSAAERRSGDPALPTRGLLGLLFGALGRDAAELLLFIARIAAKLAALIPGLRSLFLFLLRLYVKHVWKTSRDRLDDDETRRHWMLVNFFYGNLAGSIDCDIFRRGVDYLDRYDYREWLAQYIIDDTVDGHRLTLDSPLALSVYDAEFAYVDGRADSLDAANMGAGSVLRTLLRMGLTWKGSLLWEMQAGMGDTVFVPLYEVLKRRGVKFEFFNRVDDVRPGQDGKAAEIDVTVQAELVEPASGYAPLFDVNGLPCWPSEPFWEQLANGEQLQKDEVDFESYDTPGGRKRTLRLGEDFDDVVLGIAIGGLPYCAAGIIEANPRLKAMVDNVRTVRTQAAQFWVRDTSYQLGWQAMGAPVFSCFHQSLLNSWADFTHLASREAWPPGAGKYPLSLQYFCGPMLDDPFYDSPSGPRQQPQYLDETRGDELAKQTARSLLDDGIGWIWPQSVSDPSNPDSRFRDELLIDNRPDKPAESGPFDAQFFRGNVAPTERFVLSLAGTLKYRLYPDESGYENLVLAGDWTRNDFNIGNVEATVMSGMLAANALCGSPKKENIVGLGFLAGDLDQGDRQP